MTEMTWAELLPAGTVWTSCRAHRALTFWDVHIQAWVHYADQALPGSGLVCDAAAEVPGPAAQSLWDAPDGTVWMFVPAWRAWTGWMPGEDGHWQREVAEFRVAYPDAPSWDGWTPAARKRRA